MKSINKQLFGTLHGSDVYAYTLTNVNGMSATILDMGGIIQSLNVADRNGKCSDVICGFDTVEGYLNGGGYQGALIGRYGNRIGKASFELDGVTYQLNKNDGNNHLHGGNEGFNLKIWEVETTIEKDACVMRLSYVSPDGEENYPGTLNVVVTYKLTDNNRLEIHYNAVTDKKTILNLTNHSYFNLSGIDSGENIHGHMLWLDCDEVTVTDEELIPNGEKRVVDGTPFDFRTPEYVGARIDDINDPMIKMGGGYDHNFYLNTNGVLKHTATLMHPGSGRMMRMYTNQPCTQIYSANMIDEDACPFKGGIPQKKRCAICLETQHMPDGIHHPELTDVTLSPGQIYDYTTIFEFDIF